MRAAVDSAAKELAAGNTIPNIDLVQQAIRFDRAIGALQAIHELKEVYDSGGSAP